jgi:hypothetical protein
VIKTISFLLLSLLAWLWAQNAQSQILVGPVTNPANGHVYYLLSPAYWTNAEAQAVALGGHLVTIDDAAENAWVLNTFGNYQGTSRPLHIGLTDEGHEGQWTWVSGQTVTFLNWAGGEPNNGQGIFPYENVAVMYGEADPRRGLWNDMIGSLAEQQYFGVVEVPPKVSIRVSEVELCWPTLTSVVYQLQYCTSLSANTWTNLGPQTAGTGSTVCFREPVPAGSAGRLYRVVTPP